MKKITYFCDLCGKEFHSDLRKMMKSFTLQAKSNSVMFCDAERGDTHCCMGCWTDLKALTKEEEHQQQIAAVGPRDLPKVP